MPEINIGDFSKDGLLQCIDKSWDSNGTMHVSVREMIGGFSGWIGGKPLVIAKMRRFAKRGLAKPERTKHVRLIRTYKFENGSCDAATFAVTRLD